MKAKILGDERNEILQATKKDFNIFTSVLDCFRPNNNNRKIHTIELSMKYSENYCERILDIKGISGVK